MSTPTVPPRPQRGQAGATAVKHDMPSIPPRPVRKTEPSPDREAYTRSPLNLPPGGAIAKPPPSTARSEADMPRRPPSVSLPSIGQEGSEYSSYDQLPPEAHGASTEPSGPAKSVSADVPMHQPVASVPQSTAKRQIQTVTRTDSASAAAAGLGRRQPTEDPHHPPPTEHAGSTLSQTTANSAGGRRPSSVEPHPLRAKASFNRSTSSLQPLERSTSRPTSVHGGDHELGIPEIGRQIPLYPNAGDVQAPSPNLTLSQHMPGIGFFNDGSKRAHTRKRSTRQEFGPPDSYGIRHDHDHQDQFEKDWQAKHPDEAAKEDSYMHLPRPPSALTSEQLNKLVGQNVPGAGSREAAGTPHEEDVLDATEEYNLRKSPLKSAGNAQSASEFYLQKARSELSVDHQEDDHVVHVYPNSRRTSRISVGSAEHAFESSQSLDHGYASDRDAPILAADEVIKRPNSAFMHAAVNPADASGDEYYDSDHVYHGDGRRSSASRPSSRPSSMHGGYHGGPLHRFVSHEEQPHSGMGTPLEEIEEYDPLFPDDEDVKNKPKKTVARRPDLAGMHHFPSQDTWEDTPASLQYSAEVSTPEIERKREMLDGGAGAAQTFETPEQEQKRRAQNPNTMTSDEKTFVKPHFKPSVNQDLHERPGMPRFPSSDVWEDTPDSMRLETTVSGPQMDDARTAPDERPTTNAFTSEQDPNARATTAGTSLLRPSIPARPARQSKLAQEVTPDAVDDDQATGATEKSKPDVPSRPVRAVQPSSNDDTGAAPTAQKTKPAVPARPAGKFGNLGGNASFLSDLNNRLKVGPQGPPPRKEPEPEVAEETAKAPLADARKGRVKGPMRRKAGPTTELKSSSFALSPLITVWSIDEEDELQVDSSKPEDVSQEAAEKALASNVVANTHEAGTAESETAAHKTTAAPHSSLGEHGRASQAVQTGETPISSTGPSGTTEKMTAFIGGDAHTDGDVLVKDDGAPSATS